MGAPPNASTDTVVIVALVALMIFLLALVGLFLLIDSYENASNTSSSSSSSAGSAPNATTSTTNLHAAAAASASTTKKRTYYRGVRLDELLTWSATEASEALAAYVTQMEGDEREALFSALPQLTNCVLGLDHAAGAGAPRGWLNEQANLLVEPHRNLRASQQLAQRLLDLLQAAVAPSPTAPVSAVPAPASAAPQPRSPAGGGAAATAALSPGRAGGAAGLLGGLSTASSNILGASRPGERTKPGSGSRRHLDGGRPREVPAGPGGVPGVACEPWVS